MRSNRFTWSMSTPSSISGCGGSFGIWWRVTTAQRPAGLTCQLRTWVLTPPIAQSWRTRWRYWSDRTGSSCTQSAGSIMADSPRRRAEHDPEQKITPEPGYQVPFAERVRRVSGLQVAAVGLITEPQQAEKILVEQAADAVFLARALLREPTWAQRAAYELGDDVYWAKQYERARPRQIS